MQAMFCQIIKNIKIVFSRIKLLQQMFFKLISLNLDQYGLYNVYNNSQYLDICDVFYKLG